MISNLECRHNIILSEIALPESSFLAFPMQHRLEMPKTITFKDTNYTRLRTKIHKFVEANWGKITILDINTYHIITDGPAKRIIRITYEKIKP